MELFKALQEILPLVNSKFVEARHLSSDFFKSSISHKVCEGIKSGKYKNKEDIINDLYKNDVAPKTSCQNILNRSISILIGNLLLKPTDKSDYKSAYQDCKKKVALVQILRSEGRQISAFELGVQTLKRSKKYHFTSVSKTLSYELLQRSMVTGDEKSAKLYMEMYELYKEIEDAEYFVDIKLNEVGLTSAKHKKPNDKYFKETIKALDEVIDVDLNKYNTPIAPYTLVIQKFRARIIKANYISDHIEIRKVEKDLSHYLQVLKFPAPTGHIFNIKYLISPSLILIGEYQLAQNNIIECLEMRKKGEYNWHLPLIHQAILGFYSKNYNLVLKSLAMAKENMSDTPGLIEWWKICEAYIYFLSLLGIINYQSTFKIGKFLNDLVIAPKDKTGINISVIIIAEYLIKLAKGDRDPLIEKSEDLRNYTNYNLKEDSSKRSKIFFQVLRKIYRSDFDPSKFELGTKAHLSQLKDNPAKIADLEMELIPYEQLWELTFMLLAQQQGRDRIKKEIIIEDESAL